MTRLSRIRIGMTVLDRTGAVIGVVKALELTEGVKPSTSLILDDGARSRQLLEAGANRSRRRAPSVRKGYLLISTDTEEDIVESLESIGRVADTAVHLSVARQTESVKTEPARHASSGFLAEA
ncbi:hypothetical protein [Arthrobacter sp. CAN_C5]|uniref:hypothetical protein n=1 Tax=Arthrobacter sp. CAN_C5 TaxID=2760706 RepID=UPI001AE200C8|nr:hypothetical protein [Arthrobacter sp. CAN_C5]MBP2215037.1 hypothetical protein [Arthrobacter sp. CAN_C5]